METTIIVVKSQVEFDALPNSFDKFTTIKIESGETILVDRNRTNGHIEVTASSVKVCGDSSIVGFENSRIEASGNARVGAYDNCRVNAKGNSLIFAWDDSRIVASENSEVEIWGKDALVILSGNATSSVKGNEH